MDTVAIHARPRLLAGSDVANKVRRAGLLPAVMYGVGVGPGARMVAVDPQPLRKGLSTAYGRNQLFTVEFEGKQHLAICKEVQIHPVKRTLKHVDFYVVTPASPITVTLPVVLSGRSAGQKAGGRLEQITRYVTVACTPTTLPKSVEIDVTPFDNGAVMTVDSLPLPQGCRAVFKKSFKIFELFAPKIEEKAAATDDKKKVTKK
ncbi:MAG: 50S ribosomal protein L25 [Deltaproteobacteria bacterium]|nr:50S ribosomal protein L25 [Deltaproteobacteria bacterium]